MSRLTDFCRGNDIEFTVEFIATEKQMRLVFKETKFPNRTCVLTKPEIKIWLTRNHGYDIDLPDYEEIIIIKEIKRHFNMDSRPINNLICKKIASEFPFDRVTVSEMYYSNNESITKTIKKLRSLMVNGQ